MMAVHCIKLTAQQQRDFQEAIKVGILKELHREGMLSGAQLGFLLSDLHSQNTCASLQNAYQ